MRDIWLILIAASLASLPFMAFDNWLHHAALNHGLMTLSDHR